MFWKRTTPATADETGTTDVPSMEESLTAVDGLRAEAAIPTNGHTSPTVETAPVTAEAKGGGGKAFFFGTLLGVGLGAAAALLFAPKSGEEIRSELTDKGIELKNSVAAKTGGTSDMSDTVKGWTSDAPYAAKDAQSVVTDASASMSDQAKQPTSYAASMANEAKLAMRDKAAEASDKASQMASEIKDAAQTARQDVEKKL